jgi:hypothetical protein
MSLSLSVTAEPGLSRKFKATREAHDLRLGNPMVVVARDTGPTAAILLLVSILSIISIIVLIFFILQGRGNVMVVAIPGFPPESLLTGLLLGLILIVVMRLARRRHRMIKFN